jgi:hypothetical protein
LVLNRLLTAIPYFPNENVYNEEYVNRAARPCDTWAMKSVKLRNFSTFIGVNLSVLEMS